VQCSAGRCRLSHGRAMHERRKGPGHGKRGRPALPQSKRSVQPVRPAVSITCGGHSERSPSSVRAEKTTLVIKIKATVGSCGLAPLDVSIGADGTSGATGTMTGTSLNPGGQITKACPRCLQWSPQRRMRAPLIEPAPSSSASCSHTPAPSRRPSLSSCQPGACPARPSSWLPTAATSFLS